MRLLSHGFSNQNFVALYRDIRQKNLLARLSYLFKDYDAGRTREEA
jgi:hypothetical protein